MINHLKSIHIKCIIALFVLFLFPFKNSVAQGDFMVNVGALSGQKLTKQNLYAYSIINNSGRSEAVLIKGTIKFRSRAFVKYQFQTTVRAGVNNISDLARNITYNYSSRSVEGLFKQHGQLPNGQFEYCVELLKPGGETVSAFGDDCLFSENEDLFLINLLDPEDDAKISELFPMFSWSVNSPLISQLNYKIRVAEIKEGQKPNNAIMRNRPVYEQSNLRFLTQNYPVTAKSLEYFQPYAWTVDAYYKDLHMGSAETWQFVIIDDSLMAGVPKVQSYIEVNKEKGENIFYAIGKLKLKYIENALKINTLSLKLTNSSGKKVKGLPAKWDVISGENFKEYQLEDHNLKHMKLYQLHLRSADERGTFQERTINFIYVNPNFLK